MPKKRPAIKCIIEKLPKRTWDKEKTKVLTVIRKKLFIYFFKILITEKRYIDSSTNDASMHVMTNQLIVGGIVFLLK